MAQRSTDTHPKIEAMQIQIIREMPAWRKMQIINDLNSTLHQMSYHAIQQRNPDATPEQIRTLFAIQTLGTDLAHKVYFK